MWNMPSKTRLERIPKLYETEHIPLKEKQIHLHFFIGGCDWYIAEYDGTDLFWGFAILNNDLQMAEWGYISFSELKSIKVQGWLEVDCELEETWNVRKASEIDKIRIAHGWIEEETPQIHAKEGSQAKEHELKHELFLKVRAGHFPDFQDLFSEVTSPYSVFYGIDPYVIWKMAHEHHTN